MADKVRVLVVDDEAPGRRQLLRFLKARPDVELAEACPSGPQAIATIRRAAPDIVFLDVQTPEVDGFGVLAALAPDRVPRVVFVTTHDEHAVRAFEVGAIDYLLKPFDLQRFEQAFMRARADLNRDRRAYAEHLLNHLEWVAFHMKSSDRPDAAPLDRLMIKDAGRVFFLRVSEIDWVEAADNYVRIHVDKDVHLVRQTIQSLESSFDLKQFARIHRSALVNLDRVVEIRQGVSRDYVVLLQDGTQLRLSDRYRRQLEDRSRPAN